MAVVDKSANLADPRVRRSRKMLQDALDVVLRGKEFDSISVQEITDMAGLNRATFYDHYEDKSALLECMVGSRFHALLLKRGVRFTGCKGALKAVALGVCDYLDDLAGASANLRRSEKHLESAIITVIQAKICEGLTQHPLAPGISAEVLASTVSWAIYGAAQEWVRTPAKCSAEQMADTIDRLVSPIFSAGTAADNS